MKKFIYPLLAVITFVGGAVWLDNAPQFSSLVVFLSVVIGCLLGYFFSVSNVKLLKAENQVLLAEKNKFEGLYNEYYNTVKFYKEKETEANEQKSETFKPRKVKKQSKQITQ